MWASTEAFVKLKGTVSRYIWLQYFKMVRISHWSGWVQSGQGGFNYQDTGDPIIRKPDRTPTIQLSGQDRIQRTGHRIFNGQDTTDSLSGHRRFNGQDTNDSLGINMSIQVCLCLFVIGKSWNAPTCLSDAPVCLICVWNSGDQNSFTLHSPVKPNQLKRESIIIRRTRSGIIYEIFWEIHLIPFFSNYIPPRVHILG